MKRWRRLGSEEEGQILYMTLVMMLVLVIFSLVLINAIYMAVLKIKAQNTADALALSAATLKARVLNELTNANGAIHVAALQNGTIQEGRPYASYADMALGQMYTAAAYAYAQGCVAQYNLGIGGQLKRIAHENGLDDVRGQIRVYPYLLNPALDIRYNFKLLTWLAPPYNEPLPVPWPLVSMESAEAGTFVQSRVIWQARDEMIGGKYLGVKLPDIVTRARANLVAETLETPGLPEVCRRYWRVQLAQPDESVDAFIRSSR